MAQLIDLLSTYSRRKTNSQYFSIVKTWANLNYSVQKLKMAKLFCGLFCHFLLKHSKNFVFLKEFSKICQNNLQNNFVIFHFGTL